VPSPITPTLAGSVARPLVTAGERSSTKADVRLYGVIDKLRQRYCHYAWERVNVGHSDAVVFRLDASTGTDSLYAKVSMPPGLAGTELTGETARIEWLATQGAPVPEVVEHGEEDGVAWLVTRALPGRRASAPWPADQRAEVVDALVDIALALHALPAADCPFDRSLAVSVPEAKAAAVAGLVDLADLDEERRGWGTPRLLAELAATVPSDEDVVVCHGDFCLPNILVDPETLRPTGVVDLGRIGVADRYADLALAVRSLAGPLNRQYGPDHARRFLDRYLLGEPVDNDRIAFYCLLDEFF
jgi:kanamycin kinase